jgi:hypothetical protein
MYLKNVIARGFNFAGFTPTRLSEQALHEERRARLYFSSVRVFTPFILPLIFESLSCP